MIVGVLLILIILLYRLYLLYQKQKDMDDIGEGHYTYLQDFFAQHFYFYSLLRPEEQTEFVARSLRIRKNLEIIAVDDLPVSENIQILISAAFTQITFGYEDFNLENFNKIFLHPSVFYSRWVDRDVKGLTFANGGIHWSWEDFVSGFMFNDDKINLALHELAHALQIDYFENSEVDTPEYDDWLELAKLEFNRMRAEPDKAYFRAYAATNLHEFFAVSVEYFFEDAVNFRRELPQLYAATCKVLQQDMASRIERPLIAAQPAN